MESQIQLLLTQRELAKRWARSEGAIRQARAQGLGPQYLKVAGQILYSSTEVEKFERACLFHEPADVAFSGFS
jgi:hypothetical protein